MHAGQKHPISLFEQEIQHPTLPRKSYINNLSYFTFKLIYILNNRNQLKSERVILIMSQLTIKDETRDTLIVTKAKMEVRKKRRVNWDEFLIRLARCYNENRR